MPFDPRRIAYGVPVRPDATRLTLSGTPALHLGRGVFAGERSTRRLDRLAQALGVAARTEMAG